MKEVPKGRKCARCPRDATCCRNAAYYCDMHYRTLQMRHDAQSSGKPIPARELVESLADSLVEKNLICSVCERKMNWLKKDGISTTISLQHDRSGEYRLICLGCNVQHQFYDGDSFYTTPATHKHCRKCGETKPLSEFYKKKVNKSCPRGIGSWCKCCEIRISTERARGRRHAVN